MALEAISLSRLIAITVVLFKINIAW